MLVIQPVKMLLKLLVIDFFVLLVMRYALVEHQKDAIVGYVSKILNA
ncbi:MAG: hypothetical protein GF398_04280 [Chitinivibrionales bacterium]|nr:hypothetical protein [Chitinivibrionales bacterium]